MTREAEVLAEMQKFVASLGVDAGTNPVAPPLTRGAASYI